MLIGQTRLVVRMPLFPSIYAINIFRNVSCAQFRTQFVSSGQLLPIGVSIALQMYRSLARNVSSSSSTLSTARNDLKKHLRRLYQRIHPDRLAQHPDERLVNQSSFQHLQSALDPHLKPNSNSSDSAASQRSHQPSPVRQLTFFSNSQDGSERLIKTNINFHERRLANALVDLFQSLGIDPPSESTLSTVFPSSASSFSSSFRYGKTLRRAHLRQLVDRARLLRNPFVRAPQPSSDSTSSNSRPSSGVGAGNVNSHATSGSPDEATLLLHALQRRHGITIKILPYLPVQPLILLRRLAGVLAYLEEHGDSIRPCLVHLTPGKTARRIAQPDVEAAASEDKHHIPVVPVIGLGAMATDATWRTAIDCVDLNADCTAARAYAQQLHLVQVLAARALGVRLVLCEVDSHAARSASDVRLLREYEELIRDVSKQRQTPGSSADMRQLAVMITEGDEVESDANQGIVKVGVKRKADGVRKAIRKAAGVARRYAQECKRKEDEERLTESVRRELRLERLRRVEEVSDREWTMAITKLRRNSGALREVFAGISLVVGLETRLLRGGELELAHDFEVEE